MRSVVEAVALRRPDWVQALIDAFPPVGDAAEVQDLKLWGNGCVESALCVLYRRCGGDVEFVEEMLLDKLQGRAQSQ